MFFDLEIEHKDEIKIRQVPEKLKMTVYNNGFKVSDSNGNWVLDADLTLGKLFINKSTGNVKVIEKHDSSLQIQYSIEPINEDRAIPDEIDYTCHCEDEDEEEEFDEED